MATGAGRVRFCSPDANQVLIVDTESVRLMTNVFWIESAPVLVGTVRWTVPPSGQVCTVRSALLRMEKTSLMSADGSLHGGHRGDGVADGGGDVVFRVGPGHAHAQGKDRRGRRAVGHGPNGLRELVGGDHVVR